ncbi:MAG: hypothetical protein IJJ60_10690 [Clostridia bacterium]|nr:hypothetical protein [Clostridia bacterium]
MFIRSRFSGWLHKQGRVGYSSLLFAFPECFSAFQLSSFLERFSLKNPSPSRRGRRFRFPLTTRLGYHGFSGLSFNLWFEFSLRRKLSFLSAGWETRQKTRSLDLKKSSFQPPVCVLCRCFRAFPFRDRARMKPSDFPSGFPVSMVRTPAVAGVHGHAVEADRRDEKHQMFSSTIRKRMIVACC